MLLTPTGRFGWDPFAEMRRMQNEMGRLFADVEDRQATTVYPPVNLWLGEDSVVATAELPGVDESDVTIAVADDILTIQVKREFGENPDTVVWHRRERLLGAFSRTIELPFRVDAGKVRARFSNGVLEIELHRPEADKPKRIRITTK